LKKTFILFFIIMLLLEPYSLLAADIEEDPSALAEKQIDMFDFSGLNAAGGVDFRDLTSKAISGELDLSAAGLANRVWNLFFGELKANWALIRNLMLIAILSAVLVNLTDSFKNKSVGELGFYISYMALVLVLFASFQLMLGVATSVVGTLSDIMTAALPIALGLLAITGNITSATMFSPLFALVIETLTLFTKYILTPILVFATALEIVNFLTEKKPLTDFAALIRKGAEWAIKLIAVIFLALLSLQKLSAPILNNLAVKTAKAAANAIPVVGGMLSGALDTVIYWGSAAKSGLLVALVIGMAVAISVPILKIAAMYLIYRVTAALIQPISDERIVDCITAIGDSCNLILKTSITVGIMFIVSVVVLLAV
jgi:stage III sporulation protein AE